jgi:selenocysteine lyase/cysteine desulfurase
MMESILKGKISLKPTPWCFVAGTPAIESVVGLGAVVEWLMALSMDNVQSHVHELTLYVRQQCIENFNDVVIGSQNAPKSFSLNVTSYEPHFYRRCLVSDIVLVYELVFIVHNHFTKHLTVKERYASVLG